MTKRMWMIRAGRSAYLIEDFRNENIIAIGWSEIKDATSFENKAEVKRQMAEKYQDRKRQQINVAAGQFSRFLFEFKQGDYALSYDPDNRVYLVGEILSDYECNIKLTEYHHIRRVKWTGEVQRDMLSISTRNTLGAISTIFELKNEAKNEILSVLKSKQPIEDELDEEIQEEEFKEDMESRSRELIKDKVLKLDWEDMEKLFAGILRAMGYRTYLTERGPDRGRDIEASKDGLMLEEPRILVEVKHRKGKMGTQEVDRFQNVLNGKKGIFVSTGGFSKESEDVQITVSA